MGAPHGRVPEDLRSPGFRDPARAEFERAIELRPALLEAMLLRREADRCAAVLRASTGAQSPVANLAAIDELAARAGALLVDGRAEEALEVLADANRDDADVLECTFRVLEYLRRFAEASAVLDRFIALADKRSDLRVRAAQLARGFPRPR